jgi:hypothetical protein
MVLLENVKQVQDMCRYDNIGKLQNRYRICVDTKILENGKIGTGKSKSQC